MAVVQLQNLGLIKALIGIDPPKDERTLVE